MTFGGKLSQREDSRDQDSAPGTPSDEERAIISAAQAMQGLEVDEPPILEHCSETRSSEDVRACLLEDADDSGLDARAKFREEELPEDSKSPRKEAAQPEGEEWHRSQFFCGLIGGAMLAFAVVGAASSWRYGSHQAGQVVAASRETSLVLRGPLLHPIEPDSSESASLRKLTFVTAETRGRSLLESVGDFDVGFGTPVINVGQGKTWFSFKTKVELLRDYIQGLKRQADEQGVDSADHLVAFFDGKDVFWGGCSPNDFLRAYHRIVDASGAKIVFGAEIVCGEQDCNKVPPIPAWAVEFADGRDLEGGFWKDYNEGCHGTWDDACAARRDCGYSAPCAVPPAVKFLNSGFFMGPVDALADMMEWSLANYDNTTVYGDQSVFSRWWEIHPQELTLDYLGELSLQLSDLDWSLLTPRHRPGIVWNNGFDRVQCMIHGNGRGSYFAAHLLTHLTDGFHQEDLRGWKTANEP